MTGTERCDSYVTLRDYIEALMSEHEARDLVRHTESDKALDLAQKAIADSFEKHNGLISMMREQAACFARREELAFADRRINELSVRVYWLLGLSAAAGAALSKIV